MQNSDLFTLLLILMNSVCFGPLYVYFSQSLICIILNFIILPLLVLNILLNTCIGLLQHVHVILGFGISLCFNFCFLVYIFPLLYYNQRIFNS